MKDKTEALKKIYTPEHAKKIASHYKQEKENIDNYGKGVHSFRQRQLTPEEAKAKKAQK